MPASGQAGFDALLEGGQPGFIHGGNAGRQPQGTAVEVGGSRAAPQVQGLVQLGGGRGRVGSGDPGSGRGQVPELVPVQRARSSSQHVPARAGVDYHPSARRRVEAAAQRPQVGVQVSPGRARRGLAPDDVGQPVSRYLLRSTYRQPR